MEEQIDIEREKQKIDALSHIEMCKMWRFGTSPAIWRDNTTELAAYFRDRLFVHYGGFTPEISKSIGW
jgi:hypothetical protein